MYTSTCSKPKKTQYHRGEKSTFNPHINHIFVYCHLHAKSNAKGNSTIQRKLYSPFAVPSSQLFSSLLNIDSGNNYNCSCSRNGSPHTHMTLFVTQRKSHFVFLFASRHHTRNDIIFFVMEGIGIVMRLRQSIEKMLFNRTPCKSLHDSFKISRLDDEGVVRTPKDTKSEGEREKKKKKLEIKITIRLIFGSNDFSGFFFSSCVSLIWICIHQMNECIYIKIV